MKALQEAINEADSVMIDGCFSCLRDKNLGILRKLKVWSLILDVEEEDVLNEADKDPEGRFIDYSNRHKICDALVIRSKQLKQEQQ